MSRIEFGIIVATGIAGMIATLSLLGLLLCIRYYRKYHG